MSIEDAIEASASSDDDAETATVSDGEMPLCFTCDRHNEPIEGKNCETQTWRMKERVSPVRCKHCVSSSRGFSVLLYISKSFQMKTVSVALVLCLNVGVDPPDVVKTQPCARLECWIGELRNATNHKSESVVFCFVLSLCRSSFDATF